tara:strand:- start:16 stop:525 length:510 start_codon:yes stop_codon:yes gene_type:complete
MKKKFIRNFVLISFFSILISRIIPHPPNFTSTIAIMFYLPALFGSRFTVVVLLAFILSDFFIGIHKLIFFTWGSLLLVGFIAKYFKSFYFRIVGISVSCFLFFLITNFGVWLSGDLYALNYNGFITCYTLAIPFLQNSLISSLIFSLFIELILLQNTTKIFIKKINPAF